MPVQIGSNQLKTSNARTKTSSFTNLPSSVSEMQLSTLITSSPIVTQLITSMYSITLDTMTRTQGEQSKRPAILETKTMGNLYEVSTTYLSILQPTSAELVSSTSTKILDNNHSNPTTKTIDGMKSDSITTRIKTASFITTSFIMVTSSSGKISTGTPKLSKTSQVDRSSSHFEVSVSGLTSIADGLALKTMNVFFKQSSHHKANSSSHNKSS